MESTTSRPGDTSWACATTAATSDSAARNTCGLTDPIRSARARTCSTLSSPVTYRARTPRAATDATTCSSRVDLPTPGSPASRITAPGTTPPPRTRSSSAMPVGLAAERVRSIWSMGWAEADTGPACGVRLLVPTSETLPQAWHSPQRPTHLGARHPHSEHRKAVLTALLDVMAATLPGPVRQRRATSGCHWPAPSDDRHLHSPGEHTITEHSWQQSIRNWQPHWHGWHRAPSCATGWSASCADAPAR